MADTVTCASCQLPQNTDTQSGSMGLIYLLLWVTFPGSTADRHVRNCWKESLSFSSSQRHALFQDQHRFFSTDTYPPSCAPSGPRKTLISAFPAHACTSELPLIPCLAGLCMKKTMNGYLIISTITDVYTRTHNCVCVCVIHTFYLTKLESYHTQNFLACLIYHEHLFMPMHIYLF